MQSKHTHDLLLSSDMPRSHHVLFRVSLFFRDRLNPAPVVYRLTPFLENGLEERYVPPISYRLLLSHLSHSLVAPKNYLLPITLPTPSV
jgi:hypothetical protein